MSAVLSQRETLFVSNKEIAKAFGESGGNNVFLYDDKFPFIMKNKSGDRVKNVILLSLN